MFSKNAYLSLYLCRTSRQDEFPTVSCTFDENFTTVLCVMKQNIMMLKFITNDDMWDIFFEMVATGTLIITLMRMESRYASCYCTSIFLPSKRSHSSIICFRIQPIIFHHLCLQKQQGYPNLQKELQVKQSLYRGKIITFHFLLPLMLITNMMNISSCIKFWYNNS